MSTKWVLGFFLFYLDLVLFIDKPGLCGCVETSFFIILANISKSKQNQKHLEHPFVDIGK